MSDLSPYLFIFDLAILTLLFFILCTTSFVAGMLAKTIRARPDADEILDKGSLRTIIFICNIAYWISSGMSAGLLLLGATAGIFWLFGLIH